MTYREDRLNEMLEAQAAHKATKANFQVVCYIMSDMVAGEETDILSPAMTFNTFEQAQACCEDLDIWDELRNCVGEDIAWSIKDLG